MRKKGKKPSVIAILAACILLAGTIPVFGETVQADQYDAEAAAEEAAVFENTSEEIAAEPEGPALGTAGQDAAEVSAEESPAEDTAAVEKPSGEVFAEDNAEAVTEESAADPADEEILLQEAILPEDIPEAISDIRDRTAQIDMMTEEEFRVLEADAQELREAIDALPEEAAAEYAEEIEGFANAEAGIAWMSEAYDAMAAGTMDSLELPEAENSWRYQNGEYYLPEEDCMELAAVTLPSQRGSGKYFGVDVSHHQGTINWATVKSQGNLDFAIIRCAYSTIKKDRQFAANIAGCNSQKIPYGIYIYSMAENAQEAKEEAEYTLSLMRGVSNCNPTLPVFYDMEDTVQSKLGTAHLGEIADVFCNTIRSAGYDVGIYANKYWRTSILKDPAFSNPQWYQWVAQYKAGLTETNYTGRYEIWQYSSTGSVKGISGNVDCNYWYCEIPQNKPLDMSVCTPVAGKSYRLLNKGAFARALTANSAGTGLIYAADDGSVSQGFTFLSAGSGYYTIKSAKTNTYLTVKNAGTSAGAEVILSSGGTANSQKWTLLQQTDGTVLIRSALSSSLYLKYNGSKLVTAGKDSSNGEKFEIYTFRKWTSISTPFSDVKMTNYYYQPVEWAYRYGITGGTSSTAYSPGRTCTRLQAMTFLWKAAASPSPSSGKNPFSDVQSSSYGYKAVLWASENKITAGRNSTQFGAGDSCTRAEIMTFLWKAMGSPKGSGNMPFKDVGSGDYYYDAVLWAVSKGVTTGTDSTHFSPSNTCTRAQIMTFLRNAKSIE